MATGCGNARSLGSELHDPCILEQRRTENLAGKTIMPRKKPQPSDLLDNTAYLVMDLGRLYRRLADTEMRALDLNRSEWWLITHLWFFEGCTQQALADLLDMDKAGLAKLLDRLEQRQIIERRTDARDARQRRIHFASIGREIAQRVDDAAVSSVGSSLKLFKPVEIAALNGLLRRLRESMLKDPRTQGRSSPLAKSKLRPPPPKTPPKRASR